MRAEDFNARREELVQVGQDQVESGVCGLGGFRQYP